MLRRIFIFVLLLTGSISISLSLPESQEKKKIDSFHFPAIELTRKFVKSPEGEKFLDYPPYSDKMIKVLVKVLVKKMQGYVVDPKDKELLTVEYFFKFVTPERKKSIFYFMLNYYWSVSRQKEVMEQDIQDIDEISSEMDHQKLVIHSLVGVFLSFVPEADQKKMEPVKKGWEKEQENFFKSKK